MWSTILPELMSITVFILTILCLQAGHSPSYLQSYAILSLNTTGLKDSYHQHTGAGLPIHDVYNLYLMTSCSGYYANNSVPPLAGVTCSQASPYCASLPPLLPLFILNPELTLLKQNFSPRHSSKPTQQPTPQPQTSLLSPSPPTSKTPSTNASTCSCTSHLSSTSLL
jgi:hypothetical protein